MRIKDKTQIALGIINIILGVTGVIILTIQGRYERVALCGINFVCGIINILNGIETRAQRQKRKEELKAMAEMYGLTKR